MKKIVVLGGAFNPPTIAHFSLAQQIVNEIEDLDEVLFMPVNSNYKKAEMPTSNEHRFNMLEMICKDMNKVKVSRLELDYDRVLTTIETLRILREQNPDREIIFATGTDNLREFNTWNNYLDILKEFKLLVFERGADSLEQVLEEFDYLKEYRNSLIKLNNVKTNLSSTFVRNQIRNGKNIRFLVPDEILDYIEKNNLYKGE